MPDSKDIARLVLVVFGVVLIWAGMTGRVGDMLAALLAPAGLQDMTQ